LHFEGRFDVLEEREREGVALVDVRNISVKICFGVFVC